MTILSALHSSRIRNRVLGIIHLVAADEGCERDDILALITPSQPIPQAPAASTSATAPVDVQAEEVPPVASSADPTPEPQPTSTPAVQAQASSAPGFMAVDVPSTSLPGAEGTVDLAPLSTEDRVRNLHEAEPKLTRKMLAEALNLSVGYVTAIVGRLELPVPMERAAHPPIPASSNSLKERIRARHRQHPTWTAKMIANDLGINVNSASTLLASVRREETGAPNDAASADQPIAVSHLPNNPNPGAVETAVKSEAVQRRKRLGAPA